ncbi:hypothetical protein KSA08_06155 [Acinetobacter pittii]|uniref:hypothetical protein n=1 Tax=Acinetobacter pittii TaxID=48296 RepID=UPI001F2E9478|nr:hypothetical protein [Acinetobacter pittii]MCE6627722.1 hypothetical protein [Acinetobacter pittii]
MDNYKIKVIDEAESKEAQELFFELGFAWLCSKKDITNLNIVFIYAKDGVLTAGLNDHNFAEAEHKELTLPQLRDLVVLKRNDVKDANYRSKKVSDALYFKSCDGIFYFMFEGKWIQSEVNTDEGLEPINQDPALISGAEAHKALLAGENVQYSGYGEQDWDTALNCNIGVFLNHEKFPDFKFRIVPRTIKVELELPRPFEPKVGDLYWVIAMTNLRGYTQKVYKDDGDDECLIHLGAYRTVEEIKQVVEQLRKIRGTNS